MHGWRTPDRGVSLSAAAAWRYPQGPLVGIKAQACNAGQNINANRRHTDLEDDTGLCQILFGQIVKRRTESAQSIVNAPRGFLVAANPKIQISGCTNVTLHCHRMSADHKEISV